MLCRYYTFKFMRDDREARTIRISSRSALSLSLAGLVVAGLAVSGLSLGVHAYFGLRQLQAERSSLETRLADVQVQLERRRNLMLLTSGQGAKAAAAAAAVPGPRGAEPGGGLARIDTGACAVENISARKAGEALAVSFDLVNRTRAQAEGKILLRLLTREGAASVTPAEGSQLAYRIQHRKHVQASLRPQQGMQLSEARGLRVEVTDADGAVIYGVTADIVN